MQKPQITVIEQQQQQKSALKSNKSRIFFLSAPRFFF